MKWDLTAKADREVDRVKCTEAAQGGWDWGKMLDAGSVELDKECEQKCKLNPYCSKWMHINTRAKHCFLFTDEAVAVFSVTNTFVRRGSCKEMTEAELQADEPERKAKEIVDPEFVRAKKEASAKEMWTKVKALKRAKAKAEIKKIEEIEGQVNDILGKCEDNEVPMRSWA